MNVNNTTSGLANQYYQSSAGTSSTQGELTEAVKSLTSGNTEKLIDATGYSTETVGKLLNILV